MNETVLIKSELYDVKKLLKFFILLGILIAIITLIILASDDINWSATRYNDNHVNYLDHQEREYCYVNKTDICRHCEFIESNPSKVIYILSEFDYDWVLPLSMSPLVSITLIGILLYLALRSYELVVTDKRVYGKVAWGKQVDLPVDAISATATLRFFKGVSVSTASGRISFLAIKNATEIYKVLSDLLIERQQAKASQINIDANKKEDTVEQLKKYKELLDLGVITEEEFNEKKKQLLES